MHRQSLGSPSSKLRIHDGGESPISDDQKRQLIIDDDDDGKDVKPRRLSFSPSSLYPTSPSFSSPTKPEKLIHLIPVLILLCLLILYLNSHSPSQSDLAQFSGFKHPSKHLESTDISDAGRFIDSRRGEILGIRSLKNLQELDKNVSKSRPTGK